ncbi:hypothetical protein [Algoriphagus sp. NG3]|uniref:hypothetical protein n=1 Tax=Algoriphagus sp. NG3 TaxID=3097546 RepID=UPI002A7FE9D2|nr:hypothetical protein [Algoriphagus sp. NG3]WPR76297.1 hypothetical protein SLW71_02925 [Algoriphagus sp. NG3]
MIFKFCISRLVRFILLVTALCCSNIHNTKATQQAVSDSLQTTTIERIPVLFFTDTVYFISTTLGPFTAKENQITIPPTYLPEGYISPAFKVDSGSEKK